MTFLYQLASLISNQCIFCIVPTVGFLHCPHCRSQSTVHPPLQHHFTIYSHMASVLNVEGAREEGGGEFNRLISYFFIPISPFLTRIITQHPSSPPPTIDGRGEGGWWSRSRRLTGGNTTTSRGRREQEAAARQEAKMKVKTRVQIGPCNSIRVQP